MTIDPAHQSTLVELSRVEREREDLRRYASRLREQCSMAVLASGSPVKRTSESVSIHIYQDRVNGEEFIISGLEQFRDAITMIFSREPAKQDPVADAAEDEAFRVATARMDAAEAREDAAERER